MTTQNELGAKLKTLGIRLTPQRLAIAEVVVNSGDHPSVKEIYGRVKEFFPYVTLATVYSSLWGKAGERTTRTSYLGNRTPSSLEPSRLSLSSRRR